MSQNKFFSIISILVSLCCVSCSNHHPSNFNLDALYKETALIFPFHDHINDKVLLGLDVDVYIDMDNIYFMDDFSKVTKLYPGDMLHLYYHDEKMTNLATTILNPSLVREIKSYDEFETFFSTNYYAIKHFIIDKENNIVKPNDLLDTGTLYARYHPEFLGSDGKPYCMAIYNCEMER